MNKFKDNFEINNAGNSYKVPQIKTKESIWEELSIKLQTSSKETKHIVYFANGILRKALAVAASVALLMGLYFTSLYYKEIKFTTIKGQQTSIVLPDGTKVQVNTDTKISYLPWQWLQNRKVILEGEAFFNVTKGNRFEVSTNGGSVAVLGTSFNVYSRNGDFRVSCFTGRVAVNFAFTSVCHILTKGQETMSYQGKIIDCPLVFNPLKTASWRIGQFFFTNEQLAKVFEELGRQFNVNIKTCDINKRFYTGFFSNKSLKEALELVCIPMGLTYGINNNNDVLITQSTN